MEFKVITVKRNLDLAKNYETAKAGVLEIGLQGINGDVAEIEVQGPEGIDRLSVPVGAAATCQGYTLICRDVGVVMPQAGRRRLFWRDKPPTEGVMEAVFDVRWGEQSMDLPDPEKNTAHDFMLVRQYEVVNDRPRVYQNQDVLRFGDLRLEIGDRVEEGDRNYKKPRRAEFVVQYKDDEPESWQVKLDGRYHELKGYRLRVTSYDFYNIWYQAYGISIVKGRPKEYSEETEGLVAEGIVAEAHVGHTDALTLSQSRLEEAENDPNEGILRVGESKNIGKVGVKLLEMAPGMVEVMILSPKVKKTHLRHGEEFDIGRYVISLIGVHGDKAILRVEED
ncbi:MAG: hypothetical protein GYB66_16650 [Chloroflexi bacterium]|nr:hypothetical protein [Chloroflexota bacterium]